MKQEAWSSGKLTGAPLIFLWKIFLNIILFKPSEKVIPDPRSNTLCQFLCPESRLCVFPIQVLFVVYLMLQHWAVQAYLHQLRICEIIHFSYFPLPLLLFVIDVSVSLPLWMLRYLCLFVLFYLWPILKLPNAAPLSLNFCPSLKISNNRNAIQLHCSQFSQIVSVLCLLVNT